MNCMKIITFKPTIQKSNDENQQTNYTESDDENQQTNYSESNDEINEPISQVTNDPDIDEYTTDIW